jgi:hypothetical protein
MRRTVSGYVRPGADGIPLPGLMEWHTWGMCWRRRSIRCGDTGTLRAAPSSHNLMRPRRGLALRAI